MLVQWNGLRDFVGDVGVISASDDISHAERAQLFPAADSAVLRH